MKRSTHIFTGLLMAFAWMLLVPVAKATTTYNFSVGLSNGPVMGTVTGTFNLPFVNPGGSGSGAASSLVLTSAPGFGVFAGGNTVTAWADQLANQFTVTAGAITSYYFAADTGPSSAADFFQINNTANATSDGTWSVLSNEDALDNTTGTFGYVFSSTAVSFTPAASAVPEPSAIGLTLLAGALLTAVKAAGVGHSIDNRLKRSAKY